MSERLLEFELPFDEEKDIHKERIIIEEFMDGVLSIHSEYYHTYDWKEHGWYNSPDEGIVLHKEHLPEVIKTLQEYYNNKT